MTLLLFRQVRRRKSDQLRQVEGAILLHITLAMKRDSTLGNIYFQIIKSGTHSLTPFTIALLFLIGRESFQSKLETNVRS